MEMGNGNVVHLKGGEGNLLVLVSTHSFRGDVEDLQGLGFFLEMGQRGLLPVCEVITQKK